MDVLTGLIPQKIKDIPVHMDFEGQRLAEKIFQLIISASAVLGFLWGFYCQQFSQTMLVLFIGVAIACILTLPPWPIYRQKPLSWQPARKLPDTDGVKSASDSSSSGSGDSKQTSSSKSSRKKK